jgi:peptide chain release factor 1
MSTLLEKLAAVEQRYEEITAKLSEPAVLADPAEYQRLAKTRAELNPLVEQYQRLLQLRRELEETRLLARESLDPEMRELAGAELESLQAKQGDLEASLQLLLLPKDPADERNIILEIRAGAGGEEAALFAAELLRMYTRYAEARRWKVEVRA